MNISQERGKLSGTQETSKTEAPSTVFNFMSIFSRITKLADNPIARDNLSLIAIIGIYILAIYVLHAAFDVQGKLKLYFFSREFFNLGVIVTGIFFVYHIHEKTCQILITPRYLIGFLIVFSIMPVFISAFASYKQSIPLIYPFNWDYSLMRLDYILHFGHHPWRLLEPILSMPTLVRITDVIYMTWFYVLFVSCLWMGWTTQRHLRLCYLISTLLVWILLGSVLGTIFSSAGPCYYSKVVSALDDPYAPQIRRLSEISELRIQNNQKVLDASYNQAGLWELKISGSWSPFGGISAMPSIHLAMAALFACLAFELRRWLGWMFVCYTALIFIGSIVLGWHYAVDGYAGVILAILIWLLVKRFVRPVDDKRIVLM
jgi:membrane-associated phospholipid phosphatase